MAGNSLLTPDLIAKGMLAVMHNACPLLSKINKQYDNSFGEGAMVNGNMPGPSIRIRKPVRATVTRGAALDIQDTVEESLILTQSTRLQVSRVFSTQDYTLTVADIKNRYIVPDGKRMASEVEKEITTLYSGVYNSVGTPGTAPSDDLPYLQANAKLDNYAVPMSDRVVAFTPESQTATLHGLRDVFNKQETVGKQYVEGRMGTAFGLEFYLDQNLKSHLTGSRGIADSSVGAASQSGSSLAITTTTGYIFNTGDVFEIDGVYQVNYETKEPTPNLQQFVVTADTTGSGSAATLSISPAITISGPTQTVYTATGNYPASGARLTFKGAASTRYQQNMVASPTWATLASAPLYLPDGVDWKAREEQDGISIRVVRQYVINSDLLPVRMDILMGTRLLYDFAACRIWGL